MSFAFLTISQAHVGWDLIVSLKFFIPSLDFTRLLNLPISRKGSEKLKRVGEKGQRKKDIEKGKLRKFEKFGETYKNEESFLGQAFEKT